MANHGEVAHFQHLRPVVPPDSHQAGRHLSRYGTALGSQAANYDTAREAFNDALAIAQREGDARLEVRTLVDACRLDGFNLHLEESLQKSLRALKLLDGVDDAGSEVPAHHWAACALLLQGDLEGAERQALAIT